MRQGITWERYDNIKCITESLHRIMKCKMMMFLGTSSSLLLQYPLVLSSIFFKVSYHKYTRRTSEKHTYPKYDGQLMEGKKKGERSRLHRFCLHVSIPPGDKASCYSAIANFCASPARMPDVPGVFGCRIMCQRYATPTDSRTWSTSRRQCHVRAGPSETHVTTTSSRRNVVAVPARAHVTHQRNCKYNRPCIVFKRIRFNDLNGRRQRRGTRYTLYICGWSATITGVYFWPH